MKVVVYFENGRASDVVAQFDSEAVYMACLPALEDFAGNKGYIVTESCREDEELELADDLNTKASMINLGEKIAWGSDSGIMDAAAEMIRKQQSEIESLKDKLRLVEQSLEIVDNWIRK